MALTLAFLGAPSGLDEALAKFDRVWWVIVVGGLATSAFVLPMRTGSARVASRGSALASGATT